MQEIENKLISCNYEKLDSYSKKFVMDGMLVQAAIKITDGSDNKVLIGTAVNINSADFVGPGTWVVKNKKGEITPKIANRFIEIINDFEQMIDFQNHKIITWPIVKLTIEKGWKMCDCWWCHERCCRTDWPDHEYDFVTYTNGAYVIESDIMSGKMRIWLWRKEDCQEREKEPLLFQEDLLLENYWEIIMKWLDEYAFDKAKNKIE